MVQGPEYTLHAVFDRQNKAGGQLAQPASGVHEGGGIGQKFSIGHHFMENFFPLVYLLG